MTISANFPAINPSLLLDFANTKALDPRITFSRPTTATYYDNHTTVVAEQNLIVQSQAFNNASWGKVSCTVADNSTTAPDGTTTGALLTGTAGSYSQYITPTNPTALGISSASTTNNTYSIYLKAGTISSVRVYIYNYTGGANIYGTFDLTALTGVAGGTAMTPTLTITDVGNSWRRVTVTGNLGGSAGQYAVPAVYADNGTFYMWGFQAEQRSTVTAYTPTTTTAITNYIPVLLTQQSNEARFDHNPTTRESLGLLIEEQRTNLLTYSEQLDNTIFWVTGSNTAVTANQVVAPDGNITGDLVTTTSGANSLRTVDVTVTASTSYTFSVFVKRGSSTDLKWAIYNTSGASDIVAPISYYSQTTATGWSRCTVTFTTPVGCTLVRVLPVANNTTGTVFFWGAQLEAGAFATSYIPTVASQVTRSADSASMTGTNFSSWYNNAEGTVYADYLAVFQTVAYKTLLQLTDGSNNYIQIRSYSVSSTTMGANNQIISSNTTVADLNSGSVSSPFSLKTSISYARNDFASVVNGGTVSTDTSGATPFGVSSLNIEGGTFKNGSTTIKKIAYYPIRVTNAQLQGLTG